MGAPRFADLMALTKPKIGLMTLVVSAGSLALAPGSISWSFGIATLVGIVLLAGASALNMYLSATLTG